MIARVIWLGCLSLLSFLALVWPLTASALIPKVVTERFQEGRTGSIHGSMQGACNAIKPVGSQDCHGERTWTLNACSLGNPINNSGPGAVWVAPLWTMQNVGVVVNGINVPQCAPNAGVENVNAAITKLADALGCPANSVDAGNGQCQCADGHSEVNGACVPSNCDVVVGGANGNPDFYLESTSSAGSCFDGCYMKPSVSGRSGGAGPWYLFGPFTSGGPCGPGTPNIPPGVQPPTACKAGTCPGTVNGAAVCVPCDTKPNKPPKVEEAKPPAPGASAPPIANAPPGTTKAESETTCTGERCTTTTTYSDSTGASTGKRETTEEKDSFCKQNPESPLCVGSSISGACDAVTCKGDAIQCAIAKEQAKRNCEFYGPAPADHPAVVAAAAGDRPPGHPALAASASAIDFSSAIDQTERLAGGCPADQTFMVGGKALVLPLSKLCSPLEMLGRVVVSFSMLAAAFIVFRG